MKRSLLSTTALLFQSSVLTAGATDEPHRERTAAAGLRGVTVTSGSTSKSWGDDDDDDKSSANIGVSVAALSPHNGQCESGTSYFQLDLHTDESGCETSWILERIITNNDGEKTAYEYVDGFEANYDDIRHAASEELCLPPGQYRFTIMDAFGDGIAEPGYYLLALDQNVFAGSSNFGYEEVTSFVVTEEGAEAATASGVETGEVGFIADQTAAGESTTSSDDEEEEKDPITPDRISGMIDVSLATSTQSPTPSPIVTRDPPSEKSKRPLDSPQEHSDLDEPYISSWVELYNHDFVDNDMGIFHSSGVVTYYPFVKNRHGVLRIQNEDSQDSTTSEQQQDQHHESTLFSDNIAIDPTATQLQIQFSFYTNSMEVHDGFCIDTSANDGMSWCTRQCWHSQTDFENGQWYDDASIAFNVGGEEESIMSNDSLRIRFRSKTNSLRDDVLIDRVKLMEMVETEMKDSI